MVGGVVEDQISNIEYVVGGSAADTLIGDVLANRLAGGDGGDNLAGKGGNDGLSGGLGSDTLNGGIGMDVLTGGTGFDTFRFDTVLDAVTNVDVISDFSLVDDFLQLENAIFTGLAGGVLSAASFVNGLVATQATAQVLYSQATGILSFDADGTGTVSTAVKFADLTNGLVLSNTDIFVT